MFKSIALTSLLLSSTEAAGCYPVWVGGSAYSSGSLVSAVVPLNVTAGTTITKNFKCTSGSEPALSHCPSYDPSNTVQAAAAWSDQGECSGTQAIVTSAPTSKPTHAAWAGAGCPKAWVSGASYESGELAEVDGVAYKCSEENFVNAWCGNSNYKPGDSLYWEQAWTLLGSCSGTIAPTGSPIYVTLTDAGGCPDEYASGTTYEENDKVALKGIVYKCRSWPNSAWCSMAGYEPDVVNSADAWTRQGYCDGTISPTTAPAFSSLVDAGGCAPDYSDSATYEAGDKVSVGGNGVQKIIYECKAFPDDGYCSTYEPGHWSKLGWKLVGYCEGTISPTASPAFSSLADHHGCPNAYSDSVDYEASDKVAVAITDTHSVVYQCSSDVHQSRYCSQYEPGNDYKLGWKLIGYCDGTIVPTASPAFASLTEVGDGCPKSYNSASTYEAGDQVAVFIASGQAVIYECKTWPNGAYCNAGPNFSPESDNASMGWTLKGYCDGTISPTAAPIVYAPAAKCRWYNGTQPITISPWAEASLSTYVAGTRVRKDERIYKCKGYPYSLWCKMAAYEPEETAYWAEAWTAAGNCVDALAPTTTPSVSPTKSPSKSPTDAPTKAPTKAPSKSPTNKPT
ncbi:hypothetical protein ACHAXN_013046 [Cyclotella atomus]